MVIILFSLWCGFSFHHARSERGAALALRDELIKIQLVVKSGEMISQSSLYVDHLPKWVRRQGEEMLNSIRSETRKGHKVLDQLALLVRFFTHSMKDERQSEVAFGTLFYRLLLCVIITIFVRLSIFGFYGGLFFYSREDQILTVLAAAASFYVLLLFDLLLPRSLLRQLSRKNSRFFVSLFALSPPMDPKIRDPIAKLKEREFRAGVSLRNEKIELFADYLQRFEEKNIKTRDRMLDLLPLIEIGTIGLVMSELLLVPVTEFILMR
jgi:hypothetical protein